MVDEEFEKAYKFHLHADNIYHQRFNFFLVAESMLVISYVTSLTKELDLSKIGLGICIIGLIFTLIWLYVNARLEFRVVYMIRNHLKNKDDLYKEYIECVGGAYSRLFLVYTLPISMSVLWVLFICNSIKIEPSLWVVSSFILLVIFSGLLNYVILPKRRE